MLICDRLRERFLCNFTTFPTWCKGMRRSGLVGRRIGSSGGGWRLQAELRRLVSIDEAIRHLLGGPGKAKISDLAGSSRTRIRGNNFPRLGGGGGDGWLEARRVCLGFDVLIDYPRGRREAVDHIHRLEEAAVLSTTSINAFKVYYEAYKSGREKNVENAKGLRGSL